MGCLCSKIGVCFLCDYALTKPWGSLHFWYVGKPSMKVVCMFLILKISRQCKKKLMKNPILRPNGKNPNPHPNRFTKV